MPQPATDTHWHFIGGKGGVGKTTCAAALALRAARHERTLLVSTDPASSLGDALAVEVTAAPRKVRGGGDLYAADLHAATAFARWLEPRRPLLSRIAMRGTYLDEEDIRRLMQLSLPGIDEVIGLLEIVRLASPLYAHVIIDTAPTGHTLRLLASPALLGRVGALLDSLQAHHRTVVSALRGRYTADESDAIIAELQEDGGDLMARLRDPARTRISWVSLPEPMALEETADALNALSEAGLRVEALILNRATLPPPQPCDWCAARRTFEARAVAPVARRFRALDVSALPELSAEPRGVAALGRAADLLLPWTPARASRPVAHRVRAPLPGQTPVRPRDTIARSPRWLLFGGKGGVGKSTCAAATALDLARADPARRVLLLSTDPAHSLGDVFGARMDDRPRRVRAAPPNLQVRELDAAARLKQFQERYLVSVDAAFGGMSRGAAGAVSDYQAFRELISLAPPGVDEVIAIADVAEALAGPQPSIDLLVTDTAPTGHALRLLETPAVLRDWTHALMAILLKYQRVISRQGGGALASLLVPLSRRLRILEELLRDAAQTQFVIVTRAAALPRAETTRLRRTLKEMGIAVGAVIVNAVGAGTCARCRAMTAAQSSETTLLRAELREAGGYAIIVTPAEVPPPHGAPALSRWAAAWQRIN